MDELYDVLSTEAPDLLGKLDKESFKNTFNEGESIKELYSTIKSNKPGLLGQLDENSFIQTFGGGPVSDPPQNNTNPVLDFQVEHNKRYGNVLSEDGILGPKTKAAYQNYIDSPLEDYYRGEELFSTEPSKPKVTSAQSGLSKFYIKDYNLGNTDSQQVAAVKDMVTPDDRVTFIKANKEYRAEISTKNKDAVDRVREGLKNKKEGKDYEIRTEDINLAREANGIINETDNNIIENSNEEMKRKYGPNYMATYKADMDQYKLLYGKFNATDNPAEKRELQKQLMTIVDKVKVLEADENFKDILEADANLADRKEVNEFIFADAIETDKHAQNVQKTTDLEAKESGIIRNTTFSLLQGVNETLNLGLAEGITSVGASLADVFGLEKIQKELEFGDSFLSLYNISQLKVVNDALLPSNRQQSAVSKTLEVKGEVEGVSNAEVGDTIVISEDGNNYTLRDADGFKKTPPPSINPGAAERYLAALKKYVESNKDKVDNTDVSLLGSYEGVKKTLLDFGLGTYLGSRYINMFSKMGGLTAKLGQANVNKLGTAFGWGSLSYGDYYKKALEAGSDNPGLIALTASGATGAFEAYAGNAVEAAFASKLAGKEVIEQATLGTIRQRVTTSTRDFLLGKMNKADYMSAVGTATKELGEKVFNEVALEEVPALYLEQGIDNYLLGKDKEVTGNQIIETALITTVFTSILQAPGFFNTFRTAKRDFINQSFYSAVEDFESFKATADKLLEEGTIDQGRYNTIVNGVNYLKEELDQYEAPKEVKESISGLILNRRDLEYSLTQTSNPKAKELINSKIEDLNATIEGVVGGKIAIEEPNGDGVSEGVNEGITEGVNPTEVTSPESRQSGEVESQLETTFGQLIGLIETDGESIDNYIAGNSVNTRLDLALTTVKDRIKNAEYISKKEMNDYSTPLYNLYDSVEADERLSPEQKESIKKVIEQEIIGLENYEFTTEDKTGKVIEKQTVRSTKLVGSKAKGIPSQYTPTIERFISQEDTTTTIKSEDGTETTAQFTKGKGGTLEVVELGNESSYKTDKGNTVKVKKDDKGVFRAVNKDGSLNQLPIPKKYEQQVKDNIAKGKATTLLPENIEFKESILDEKGNVTGARIINTKNNTELVVNDPELALDLALSHKINTLGPIAEGVFEEVISTVEVTVDRPIKLVNEGRGNTAARATIQPTTTGVGSTVESVKGEAQGQGVQTTVPGEVNTEGGTRPKETSAVLDGEVIEDKEFNDFIDKGTVTKERLNSIANKVKNNKALTEREKAIFADKTSEINELIKGESDTPQNIIEELGDTSSKREKQIEKFFGGNKEQAKLTNKIFENVAEFFGKRLGITGNEYLRNKVTKIGRTTTEVATKIGGTKFQIIGEKGAAKLSDGARIMDNLNLAKQLDVKGEDKLKIKLATGWEKDSKNGEWKYEIADSRFEESLIAQFKDLLNKMGIKKQDIKLSDVYDNKELYKAYPHLKDITFKFEDMKGNYLGYFDLIDNVITINTKLTSEDENESYEDIATQVIIHEIQHAIQNYEGWPNGGDSLNLPAEALEYSVNIKNVLDERAEKLAEAYTIRDPKEKDLTLKKIYNIYKPIINRLIKEGEGYNLYARLAGEVEARNAANRSNLTNEQKLNSLLTETEDVNENSKIYLKDKFKPIILKSEVSGDGSIIDQATEKVAENLKVHLNDLINKGKKEFIRTKNPEVREMIKELEGIRDGIKFQGNNAAVVEEAKNKLILLALETPNVSSAVHELYHIFESDLNPEEKQTILDSYNNTFKEKLTLDNLTPKQANDVSEWGARLWEKYFENGRKLSTADVSNTTQRSKLQEIFDKFTNWMSGVYNGVIEYTNSKGVTKEVKVSPKVQDMFDKIFLGQDIPQVQQKEKVKDSDLPPIDLNYLKNAKKICRTTKTV